MENPVVTWEIQAKAPVQERAGVGSPPAAARDGISAMLADPIVQAVMAADQVDPSGLERLLRRLAASLGSR